MLLYICWQKCQIYIVPAKLRKYKYIYNIVKETVTLNIKLTEESIYTKSVIHLRYVAQGCLNCNVFFSILLNMLSDDACIEFVSKKYFVSQD